MTDIMLSIDPKYAGLILDEEKTIEVRKRMPTELYRSGGGKVYLYATSPIGKVVGCAEWSGVDCWTAGQVPESVCDAACLTRDEVFQYLDGKMGFFWQLKNPVEFMAPTDLCYFDLLRPPQSFCYLPPGVPH